ncbi:amidohydrolase family protein [Nocardioides sp. NPDC087217]|uniref:amidohydrolase family protein n=1 Tax=Nocardioides sp. NPDC087217 TaxID=3364335 RepID=UPI003802EDAD
MSRRTLITNATLLTLAEPAPPGINQLLVEDGRIAAIGQDLGVTDAEVIDAREGIVMPGMVDTHRHTWQSLLRATLADGSLYDYMAQVRYGYAPHFTAGDAELGNYAGALDALNAGVTTVVDNAHLVATPDHADALLTGLENAGIRAVYCYGLPDVADPDVPIETERTFTSRWRHQDAERLRAERLPVSDGLIRFGISGSDFLFAPLQYTVPEVELARRLDAHRFSVHVANGPFARGTRYVTRLLNKGLVDDRTLFVHGNVLSQADLSRIASIGASISVTPESEMQMGMGTPIWPAARNAGVACGLGVDIVSGGSGDLFTQMRLALAAGRMAANDKLGAHRMMPEKLQLNTEHVLRAATIEGARAAGLENEVGTLEVGKRADLILVRTAEHHLSPLLDPVKTVVVQAGAGDVELVMVDGRVVKRDGELVGTDRHGIEARLQQTAERIFTATTQQSLDQAYTYVRAAFPLDRATALGARFVGKALQVRGLDNAVFRVMLAQSAKSEQPVIEDRTTN